MFDCWWQGIRVKPVLSGVHGLATRLSAALQGAVPILLTVPILLIVAILLAVAPVYSFAQEKGVILVWGDSLSAAHGIDQDQGWPKLLQKRLMEKSLPFKVINGSVSGETTAGGLARLPAELARHEPAIVLLELGANDGLRGLPVEAMREQLSFMIEYALASGAQVLLFEMKIPPNYGPKYANAFEQVFTQLADAYPIDLLPFWLEPIALDPAYLQADGLHPNARAQPLLLDEVWEGLQPMLAIARP